VYCSTVCFTVPYSSYIIQTKRLRILPDDIMYSTLECLIVQLLQVGFDCTTGTFVYESKLTSLVALPYRFTLYSQETCRQWNLFHTLKISG